MKEVEGEGFTRMISLNKRNIIFIHIFAKNAFIFVLSLLYAAIYTGKKQANPLQLQDTHCIHMVLQ